MILILCTCINSINSPLFYHLTARHKQRQIHSLNLIVIFKPQTNYIPNSQMNWPISMPDNQISGFTERS